MTTVNLSALAGLIENTEFDSTFTLDYSGNVTASDAYAPEVSHDADADVLISGVPYVLSTDWSAMTGLTGQYAYHGPVMHASEYVGEGVARAMLELTEDGPLTFVMVTVEVDECDDDCDDECEGYHDPAGWAILYRPAGA
jgi:hypothetical protein